MKTIILTALLLCGCTSNVGYQSFEDNGATVTCKMPTSCKRGTILFNCSNGQSYKCW